MTSPLFYSPAEAAKYIGVGRTTIFAILARGEIKARKLGTRTLISASDLQKFMEALPAAQFQAHQEQEG